MLVLEAHRLADREQALRRAVDAAEDALEDRGLGASAGGAAKASTLGPRLALRCPGGLVLPSVLPD